MNDMKINVAELLKDCPKGMELDCTIYDDVEFMNVDTSGDIILRVRNKFIRRLNKYGKEDNIDCAKCVIFPKGKTTWEGFVPPCKFKDGDVLFVESVYNWIIIYKESENDEKLHKYVAISDKPNSTYMVYDNNPLSALCYKEEISKIRFATEEEKDKLFKVIKDKGYRWNAETKTLEKLIEAKFKVGDNVEHPQHYCSHPSGIECIEITRHYCFSVGNAIKYLWRAGLKKEMGLEDVEKEVEDLKKAIWYINDRIKQLKES